MLGYYILEPGPALTLFYTKNIALKKDHIQRKDEIESRHDRGNSNNVLPKISSHPEDEIIAKLQKLTRQSNYNFFLLNPQTKKRTLFKIQFNSDKRRMNIEYIKKSWA